jgi:serine/threonine protein kinase
VPPPPTGGYPAARPSTGRQKAVQPRNQAFPSNATPSGFYPAAEPTSRRPPSTATPSGGYPAVSPSTGRRKAVRRPSDRARAPSDRGPSRRASSDAGHERPSDRGRVRPSDQGHARPSDKGHARPSDPGHARPSDEGPLEKGSDVGLEAPQEDAFLDDPALGKLPRGGDTFDGYTIGELIGQGNMGRIYRARDRLGRDVAVKVILTEVASEEGLARFEREGQAMASIPRHKYVIGIHSAGSINGRPYLVLDYVQGESLESVLKRGPLPAVQAVLVAEKLSRALDHVHQAGVLHRDLKPANVLIRSVDGEPILMDFGLAGLRGADTLTKTGDVIGTPLYMAPEQVLGLHREVDGRADVWAIGVMLYEMATGTLPFPGATMLDVLEAVTGREPPPIHEACKADESLTALVARALAKDKQDRIPSPGAMASALRAWRKAHVGGGAPPALPLLPSEKRRRLVLGLAGVVALLAVILGVIAYSRWRDRQAPSPGDSAKTDSGGDEVDASATAEALEHLYVAAARKPLDVSGLSEAIHEPALTSASLKDRRGLQHIMDLTLVAARQGLEETPPRFSRAAKLVALAGQVQRLVPEERWTSGIPTWIVEWSTRREKILSNSAHMGLIDALAGSGIRPRQRALLGFLDRLNRLDEQERPRLPLVYYRVLVACTQLGVPLATEMHVQLPTRALPKTAPQNADEAYLFLRLDLLLRRRVKAQREEILGKMVHLLDRLSPVNQLEMMRYAFDGVLARDGVTKALARMEKALEAAPNSAYGRLVLARLHQKHALDLAGRKDAEGVAEAMDAAWKRCRGAVDLVAKLRGSDSWEQRRQEVYTQAITTRLAQDPRAMINTLRTQVRSPAAMQRALRLARELRDNLDSLLGKR